MISQCQTWIDDVLKLALSRRGGAQALLSMYIIIVYKNHD